MLFWLAGEIAQSHPPSAGRQVHRHCLSGALATEEPRMCSLPRFQLQIGCACCDCPLSGGLAFLDSGLPVAFFCSHSPRCLADVWHCLHPLLSDPIPLPAGPISVHVLWYVFGCVQRPRRSFDVSFLSDIVKESPSLLATRNWTPFAYTRLRRYNEVSHYLKRRLNRAYKPATEYINTFPSRLLANFAE